MSGGALLLACGALARELVGVQRMNGWDFLRIQCLPAELHMTPEKIPDAVAAAIEAHRDAYAHIFVAYADCGTGGRLDKVLAHYGVERIPGAHCYEWFAGAGDFAAMSEAEPGTFYLTDFLVRHFDRLVIRALGLDRHPALRDLYFGNYRRVIYLAQTESADLVERAAAQAEFLGLEFETRFTGLGRAEATLQEQVVRWLN